MRPSDRRGLSPCPGRSGTVSEKCFRNGGTSALQNSACMPTPCTSSRGGPSPVRCAMTTGVSSERGRVVQLMSRVLRVPASVPDAMVRPAAGAGGTAERDDDLVVARCVGNRAPPTRRQAPPRPRTVARARRRPCHLDQHLFLAGHVRADGRLHQGGLVGAEGRSSRSASTLRLTSDEFGTIRISGTYGRAMSGVTCAAPSRLVPCLRGRLPSPELHPGRRRAGPDAVGGQPAGSLARGATRVPAVRATASRHRADRRWPAPVARDRRLDRRTAFGRRRVRSAPSGRRS